jgi:hypothetical protein
MVTVELPDNFMPERRYCADVLLGEIIGIDFSLRFAPRDGCLISCMGKQLHFSDQFWKPGKAEAFFLDNKRIPSSATDVYIPQLDSTIACIYGKPEATGKDGSLHIGVDIFASAFFMLTRWEETVIKERDKHGRFPSELSLAAKAGFIGRPVVNEYASCIRDFLEQAGCADLPPRRDARFFMTHDIDFVFKWNSALGCLKTIGGDLIKRRSLKLALQNAARFAKAPITKYTDPYNSYAKLLKDAARAGASSIFYFLPSEENLAQLRNHHIWLMKKLRSGNATLGIHGGYHSYLPNGSFYKEKQILEAILGETVEESRQHFLRFEVPDTWNMLEKRGIAIDSSLYYTDLPGFRTGCCTEFSCFDIFHRNKMKIKERSLCFMDTSLFHGQWNLNIPAQQYVSNLIEQVEKHGGDFVLLWHNSSFDLALWHDKYAIYEQIIGHFAQKNSKK